jgi:hypothetical protein
VKTFRIAAMMVLLAGPAYAQGLGANIIPDAPSKTPDQIEREQALERSYKESLKKIPDGKASNDPWGNVRSAETPARTPAAKTSAAKPAPIKGNQAKTSQAKPAATAQ